MSVNLTKSVRVVRYIGPIFDTIVEFGQEDEDAGLTFGDLRISKDDYDAFGRPEILTITIQPGDLLN